MGAAPFSFHIDKGKDLTVSITMWLALGERGISSEAIALTALGVRPTGLRASWPHDSADFRRCLLLLEEAPETFDDGLLVLAKHCAKWAALVKVWDLIAETLRSEIGMSLTRCAPAPRTDALIREALDSALEG